MASEVEEGGGAEDQAEGDDGDEQLGEGAHHEGAHALLAELAEVRLEPHAGESEQERPAGEVREAADLRLVEGAQRGEQRDEEEPEDELGELLPDERRLVRDRCACPRAAQYSAYPSTTKPIIALRVDLVSTATLPAASE